LSVIEDKNIEIFGQYLVKQFIKVWGYMMNSALKI
jgi:hypothetical protein